MKIPKQATKVFSWVLFDVYQWKQKLYDGTFATFEMVKRPACNEVIATVGNKIIVLKQSQPWRDNFYWLPWGRVEQWESSLKGAKRELLEETGFVSQNWQKFQSWNEASKIDFEETLFVAKNCEMSCLPHPDAWEKISMQLVSFDDFCMILKSPNSVAAIWLKFLIYECLLDKKLKAECKKFIFWK